MPYTLESIDYNPFQADEAAASAPPVDYSRNGGLVAYGQNLKNQLSGYLENSVRGLQRIPGDVADYADTVGNTVAKPYLQGLNELYSTDWSKQPFVGVGEHGELTGRLPALAQVTVPFLAGGAPGGSLGAGMKIPGGYEGGYHGTPHTFPAEPGYPLGRFSDAAIGSGEGAQAYGYGHYVAGHEGVAKSYQESLVQLLDESPKVFIGDKNMNDMGELPMSYGLASRYLVDAEGDVDKAIAHADSLSKSTKSTQESDQAIYQGLLSTEAQRTIRDNQISTLNDTKQVLEKHRHDFRIEPAVEGTGNLYHVEIKPKEEELLDWDKPLSEQHENVQKVLEKFNYLPDQGQGWTGEMFYKDLARALWDKTREGIGGGSKAASQMLHKAGIPGIKYLDQGSRNPGFTVQSDIKPINGLKFPSERYAQAHLKERYGYDSDKYSLIENPVTSNYVIFHPDNLRVVGKNGETIENHLQNVE